MTEESAPAWRSGVPLAPAALCQHTDPAALEFARLEDLPPPPGLVGQERAIEAVNFAVGIRRPGFNLFAFGPAGTGKHTLVREILERQAPNEPVPPDWCYVNNFSDPHRPKRLMVPAGRARPLKQAMGRLLDDLRVALPQAFEREDYRTRLELLEQQFKERHEHKFSDLQERAEKKTIAIIRTPMGLALAPVKAGEVMPPEAFQKLPEPDRKRIEQDIETLQTELEGLVRQIPEWERERRDAVRDLNRATTAATVGHLFQDVRNAHVDLPDVVAFLAAAERDILENGDALLEALVGAREAPLGGMAESAIAEHPLLRRYQVNVMVDNGGRSGAPVIYEDHPTHQNLVGRAEHMARFGALTTDFNLLLPGALHRANGGYLVVDIERLLRSQFAYDSLKQALRAGEIRIASLEQLLSLASTVSLEPEPIPLGIKVVLIGAPIFYYLLAEFDPDFRELFKVAADFDDRVARDADTTMLYTRIIAAAVRREKLRPLDRAGIARVVDFAARLSGDAEKLSTEMRSLIDLLQESDYVAGASGHAAIGRDDVQKAIDSRERRADRIHRRFQEEIGRGTIRIETAGETVGQVNGLSIVTLGNYYFGHPSRITAQIRLGRGEVIDIEREVALGGPLHSKGVLILAGFLGGRFGKAGPLSLTASLVFEQSYGGVEGDSASLAELFALLSALAEVPVRQSLAVTGSVDQHGQVQAIGGVNEKIEGFFDICRARGLDGSHGVLIPAANVKHLMLRDDVVAACAAGKFKVIPIETVDQGIELLTGNSAGAADVTGTYPEASFNRRVAARLAALARRAMPPTFFSEAPRRPKPPKAP